MAKSDTEKQQDRRDRMRAQGYVLRQVWVHPDDLPRVKDIIDGVTLLRECLTALNAKPNFSYGPRQTSYKLASRIEAYIAGATDGSSEGRK